jgi:hypothetical protein
MPTAPAGMISERSFRYLCRSDIETTPNVFHGSRVFDKLAGAVKLAKAPAPTVEKIREFGQKLGSPGHVLRADTRCSSGTR